MAARLCGKLTIQINTLNVCTLKTFSVLTRQDVLIIQQTQFLTFSS